MYCREKETDQVTSQPNTDTKVAAGSKPESTLAIKNRKGDKSISLRSAPSGRSIKNTNQKCRNSSSFDFYFDQSKSEIASYSIFLHVFGENQDGMLYLYVNLGFSLLLQHLFYEM